MGHDDAKPHAFGYTSFPPARELGFRKGIASSGRQEIHVEMERLRVAGQDENDKESLRWTGRENGQAVVLDSEPYAGNGLKLTVAVMKLLPIESQL